VAPPRGGRGLDLEHDSDHSDRPRMTYLFLAVALTLNAIASIMLKMGAERLAGLRGRELAVAVIADYPLLLGLALFALNFVFYTAALVRLDLSVANPIMTAGGMVIVVCTSVLFLRESVTAVQLTGVLLLVIGIALVAHR
jgi:multidrug transporter EmrE-like cation transporter